jgi:hypothetical protein
MLFNSVISRVAATQAAVVLNLIPVFAFAGAVVFLGEGVTSADVIGAALVGTSVVYFTAADHRAAWNRHQHAHGPRVPGPRQLVVIRRSYPAPQGRPGTRADARRPSSFTCGNVRTCFISSLYPDGNVSVALIRPYVMTGRSCTELGRS